TLRERRTTNEEADGDGQKEEDEGEASAISRCSSDLVDWRKPLAWQVGYLGERYDTWVHQPVDRPIRLFESSLLEATTNSKWYSILIFWLPIVFYCGWHCFTTLAQETTHLSLTTELSFPVHMYWFPLFFALGLFFWSFLEYIIHRFLFHLKPPSPYDSSRLVFPPIPCSIFVGLLYLVIQGAMSTVLPAVLGDCIFVGIICGYLVYDMVHYYMHYGSPKSGTHMYTMKALHIKHHFEHHRAGFGITSTFWDHPFHTTIPDEKF
ncbi:hypothetical protein NHX12_003119, partial [Muraenolepis orangiensis]